MLLIVVQEHFDKVTINTVEYILYDIIIIFWKFFLPDLKMRTKKNKKTQVIILSFLLLTYIPSYGILIGSGEQMLLHILNICNFRYCGADSCDLYSYCH